MAGQCDLLLGPYSTQLMRAAGHAMEDVDGLLWNHGGSGDDVQGLCAGRIVSVLAPTTRYAEPFVSARASEAARAPLWVVRGRGRFARQVAAGAVTEAERVGLQVVEKPVDEHGAWLEEAPETWDLFSVGTFEDDVAIVNDARSAPRPPRGVCSVAAGVRDFASMVDDPEGIYGIAQWFPGRQTRPEVGPTEHDFVTAYRRIARRMARLPGCASGGGWSARAALRARRREHRGCRAVDSCDGPGDDDAVRRVSDRLRDRRAARTCARPSPLGLRQARACGVAHAFDRSRAVDAAVLTISRRPLDL